MSTFQLAATSIDVDPEIPTNVLFRICNRYGTVHFREGEIVVVPNDKDAGGWILRTLAMLGYTAIDSE